MEIEFEDHESTFEELLAGNDSRSTHVKNSQKFITEIFNFMTEIHLYEGFLKRNI